MNAPDPVPAAPPKCDLCNDAPATPEAFFLHAACHLAAPLQVSREADVLVLRCYVPECHRLVGRFRLLTPEAIDIIGRARAELARLAADPEHPIGASAVAGELVLDLEKLESRAV